MKKYIKYAKFVLPILAVIVLATSYINYNKSLDLTVNQLMLASEVISSDYEGKGIPSVLMGNSMYPTIPEGSVIIILPEFTYEDIEISQVVAAENTKMSNSLPADYVTHRVIEITEDGLRTKGDNNPEVDNWIVTPENYKGLVIGPIK